MKGMCPPKDGTMQMAAIALEFKSVNKTFENAPAAAVLDLSLTVAQGDFVTILGTSGSGKTTLLKMVNRLYEPSSGEIYFFGRNIAELDPVAYRRKIGYVIQQVGLFPHMTVAQNIATVPKILKWEKARIENRIDELLQLVELDPGEYRNRYPAQLSGGQQQRVGLARAMAADPDMMLMDEPFGAIDAITRQNLQDALIKIHRKLHKTILFVTHDIHEAFKLGNKVIIMDGAVLQQYDTPYRILLHPRNDYVARLISSEDLVQRLQLLQARAVMQPVANLPQSKGRSVEESATLAQVLALFMQHERGDIWVTDMGGNILGKICWSDLAALAQTGAQGSL